MHSVLYKQFSLDQNPRVLLDPNQLSSDDSISLNTISISPDGRMFAYSISKSGSDWNTVKVRNTETGYDYPDLLENVKYSSFAWTHDNNGFFYSVSNQYRSMRIEKLQQFWQKLSFLGLSKSNNITVHSNI